MKFSNSYSKLPERFYERVNPVSFSHPQLVSFNQELAQELGLGFERTDKEELAQIFSGQKILPGSEPLAMAYAAHQFGHFVPQLGDGRAHLLGEFKGLDIQLKGSGQTRFSRNGDGRSALGPVIREYLVSEAMHHLGVPSTRALAAVTTGETVYRNEVGPGGILTRMASSLLRVGTFQYFAFAQDHEALNILLDYAIDRHYPQLKEFTDLSEKAMAFITEVGKSQANLIAKWMSLGFIHGVMNTDNYSIAGITIDFGPCAFMDEFKKDKVFSFVDREGRYCYQNQVKIGQWNLIRLADCLLPLIDKSQKEAIKKVESAIEPILQNFEDRNWQTMASKFGVVGGNLSDYQFIDDFLHYLEEERLDFTLSFRNLENLYNGQTDYYPHPEKLQSFLSQWRQKVPKKPALQEINPLLIPRNHQVERAIQQANRGEYQIFYELLEAIRKPFAENDQFKKYTLPPTREERVIETFCGT